LSAALVSVALATYNGERYLREQLDTVYAQTYPSIEVAASDDASSDGSVAILEEYARSRGLRYAVNSSRLGLVKNFERAITLCRGDFIALCDQDDLWKADKLATLVARIGDATLIYGNLGEVLDLDGQCRREPAFEPIFRFARLHGSGHPSRYLLAENWVVSHGMLFRRALISHALPIPEHQAFHDGWLALVASKLGGIRYLDQSLQVYRRHPESHTFKQQEEPPSWRSLLPRLWGGRLKRDWSERCGLESARLQDAAGLRLLDADDRGFLNELLSYYRSGLQTGHGWSSFRAGLRVAPFVATRFGRSRLWFALRGFAGSL
jgi:glycosyltransferase involved in cell wall biosynthesis